MGVQNAMQAVHHFQFNSSPILEACLRCGQCPLMLHRLLHMRGNASASHRQGCLYKVQKSRPAADYQCLRSCRRKHIHKAMLLVSGTSHAVCACVYVCVCLLRSLLFNSCSVLSTSWTLAPCSCAPNARSCIWHAISACGRDTNSQDSA